MGGAGANGGVGGPVYGGGLIGRNNGSNAIIDNSYATVNVNVIGGNGGIAGAGGNGGNGSAGTNHIG